MMGELRTMASLLRELTSMQERMLVKAIQNDARAEAREEELRLKSIALRVQGKVNVQQPTVTVAFDRCRRNVEATERNPLVKRAVLDALRDLERDITEEWNSLGHR